MSKIEVNTVEPQCGTTLTLGASGDTVTLGSGASQSGFGRTGTVDWQTTKKTATFTAANGEGYFVDTSGGAVTMNLPSSPSAGNIVAVKDYGGDFATNNLTIGRGGSPINGGSAADVTINTAGASIVLVYVDATQGWVATQDDSSTIVGAQFLIATGGTITTSGNCKIHTFTGPGTFTVCQVSGTAAENTISYMVVAGGGAGGGTGTTTHVGAGGGAGGFREYKAPTTPYTASPLDGNPGGTAITVTAQDYPITVGGGGTSPGSGPVKGGSGSNSIFSTITSAGGGGGGSLGGPSSDSDRHGSPGGSGGGGSSQGARSGGSGNTPPVSPPQGTDGAQGVDSPPDLRSGSGGGATAAGSNGSPPAVQGAGGAGATTEINGSSTAFAGGGGSGGTSGTGPGAGGAGGAGGGGAGGPGSSGFTGSNGTDNTGGGAGGAGGNPTGPSDKLGGTGGSGIVVIRYKFK